MSEERDLEKELKEEKDRYERQNQEAYDMEIENEIKRKRQAEEAQRQETKRKLKGEARREQRQERKQVQTGGNTGEEFIPDKTGDFAPAPDRDMRTGEQIFNRETDQFGNPVYESNRQKLQATRNLDPNRFQSQLETIQKFTPDLSDPKEASEFFTDLAVDAGIIGRSLGEDLPTGIATVIARRLAKSKNVRKTIEDGIGKVAETAQQISDDTIPNAGLGIMKKMKEVLSPDDPITVFAMSPEIPRKGGFSDEAERRIAKIQKDLRVEKGDQLGLFTNEGDEFLYEKYKAQNKVIGTPLPKRQQAGRALRPSDFDDIIEEYPEITPDLIFAYIESTKADRFGRGVKNPKTGRLKRNNRGLEGTLKFLNRKSAPDPNFDLSEIAAELSAEFNKTITPKTLSNIIDENVRQGTFTFQTQGMSKPIEIKSIDDLRKAYMGRVARYRNIPAFERGHVFAADNIIKDNKIKNLTDFKNNLEPDIARSIYAQLDDQALDELIKANVDGDFSNIESLYKQILAGNRSRKNLDDPDKVIAALYGRDYGLRESFLNFVYPNRSLNRLIPPDLKAAFTDHYKKELAQKLSAYQGLSIGPASLDKIRADVAQEVLKSFPDVDSRFVLEQMTISSDKAFLKDVVDEATGEAK